MDKNKWIKICDGVEYSTDFDLFRQHQVGVTVNKNGTVIFSRLDGSRFLSTSRRTLPDSTILKLIRHVHRDICELKYGGRIVD